jgi:hypothetical protein
VPADEEDDPSDPSHPDHDLSEAAGYAGWEAPAKPWFLRRWVHLLIAVLVVFALLLPFLQRVL